MVSRDRPLATTVDAYPLPPFTLFRFLPKRILQTRIMVIFIRR